MDLNRRSSIRNEYLSMCSYPKVGKGEMDKLPQPQPTQGSLVDERRSYNTEQCAQEGEKMVLHSQKVGRPY
jgi:hypothetical protein